MTLAELYAWAQRHGYVRDSWGHCKKSTDKAEYRIKVQSKSWRWEKKVHVAHTYGPDQNIWVRLESAYFGQSHIDPETDKLVVNKSRKEKQ